MYRKGFYQSMVYCLIYVSIGTVALFSLSSSSPLHGEWAIWTMFLTIPTSVLSFVIMFAFKGDPTILVLIVQFFMFLMAWRIIYSPIKPQTLSKKIITKD
jgi:hypothetical protein